MKLNIFIMCLLSTVLISCSREEIIPKEDMVKIYHDMYLLDQSIMRTPRYSRIADTLLIYRPIFEKYGYDCDDYAASVKFYLERPEKFGKLFQEVKDRFQHRIDFINDSLARIENLHTRWELLDSVRFLGHDSLLTTFYYRMLDLIFFERDTVFKPEYLKGDSAATASYKLFQFELYDGNPFKIHPFSPERQLASQDSTSTVETRKTAETFNTEHQHIVKPENNEKPAVQFKMQKHD